MTNSMPLNKNLQTCLKQSKELAVSFGHSYMNTGHLLLGLLKSPAGKAYIVLETLGVFAFDVERELKALHPPVGQFIQEPALSKDIEDALCFAQQQALKRGAGELFPEDLLAAIMSDDCFSSYKIAVNLGVAPDLVVSEIFC